MDGYLDGLPQILRMIAAIPVVVMPPPLNISKKSFVVEQGGLVEAVKAEVVLVQVADLVFQICHLNLFVFGSTDHIDFFLRQRNCNQLAAKRAPDAEGIGCDGTSLHYDPGHVICSLNCHHPAIKMFGHQAGEQHIVDLPGWTCGPVNTAVLPNRKPGRIHASAFRLTYEDVQTFIAETAQDLSQCRFIVLCHEDDLVYELRLLAMLIVGDANHFIEIAKLKKLLG